MKRKPKQQVNKSPNPGVMVAPGKQHPIATIMLGCFLLAAVINRFDFLDRSLWLDEAWVANAIRAHSLWDAIYYPDWLQTTPPLFIVLSRLIIGVFGESNTAFRLLPSLAGFLSVAVLAFLAWKLLKPVNAVIAVFLFVFSPKLILYSQSLKQYSTDVLCTLILLACGYLYLQCRTERSFYRLLLGFIFLSFLSYQVMLFLPFLFYCAIVHPNDVANGNGGREIIQGNWFWMVAVSGAGAGVALVNYFCFIEPNKTFALVEFFPEGFYHGHGPGQLLAFYVSRLSTLAGGFFFGGAGVLSLAAVLLTMVGFISLWISSTAKGIRNLHLPILLTVPLVGVVMLNVIGIFPLPDFNHRILLFLFPITVLVCCLGLQTTTGFGARLAGSWLKNSKTRAVENGLGTLLFIMLLGLLVLFFSYGGLRSFFLLEHEDAHAAVEYLARRLAPDNVLYVHASMREQLKLYGSRSAAVSTAHVVNGTIGSPCCPRQYRSPIRETISDVAGELNALSLTAAGRQLWVLMTDRSSHWRESQRNDIRLVEHGLTRLGCDKVEAKQFTGVYLARFDCRGR